MLLLALAAPPLRGQLPPDTYRDEAVRELVERAREARELGARGLESFEGRLRERLYVGLAGARFRRERGLFHQERAARILWRADGNHVVRWEGARRDIPVAGLSSVGPPDGDGEEDEAGGPANRTARELARALSRGAGLPPILSFEPGSDRIVFGIFGSGDDEEGWALHPLADTAGLHYRYRSGDTLTVTLPGRERPVSLVEVRVEPRRAAFHLLSASLWFDEETATLVRAIYRPSRPFNLEVDEPEDAADVPRILRPVEFEVRHITADHGLYDFRWWIPRRFSFEGELRMGGFVRLPARFEWAVGQLVVNEEEDPGLIPDDAPPGWTVARVREEEDDDGNVVRGVTVVVPPPSLLGEDPALSPPDDRGSAAFGPEELRELEGRLRGLGSPGASLRPRLAWGLQEGMLRYNRVEGPSAGAAATFRPRGDLEVRLEARMGAADLEPKGEVRVRHGSTGGHREAAIYRRLAVASEWTGEHTFSQSVATLLYGRERTPYFRTTGSEIRVAGQGLRSRREVRLFAEAHRNARRETNAHAWRLVSGDSMSLNLQSDRGSWFGGEVRHRWQTGVDPERVRLFTQLRLEGAGGTSTYGRGWAGAGVTVPLGARWAAGLEGAAGATAGEPPAQRLFFPGGGQGFRGLRAGHVTGEAFWLARAELGIGLTAARVSLFSDLLRIGARDEIFRSGSPFLAVGSGLSFLDGMVRVDVVRGLRGKENWRLIAYLDGLL